MHRHRATALGYLAVFSALLINTPTALAANEWRPNDAPVIVSATRFEFEVENNFSMFGRWICDVSMRGALGTNSTTWNISVPFIGYCRTPTGVGVPTAATVDWKAIDESAMKAGLEIPAGGSFKLLIAANCKINIGAQTITSNNNYINGNQPVPSYWKLGLPSPATVAITQTPAACYSNALTARLPVPTNDVLVQNAALNPTESIKVT